MVWKFMISGGWSMAPIVLCSVAAMALLLERGWFWLGMWRRKDERLREELVELRTDERRAERSGDPVCRVLAALIRHPEDPSIATAAADRILRETRAPLPVLNVIGGVSCSLGLFGTVLGVSLGFEALAQSKPEDLALSLAVALNTTILGLIVYLPTYVGSSVCAMLTNRLAFDIEQGLNALNVSLRSRSMAADGDLART